MFWENLKLLCAQKGVSPNAMAEELSISSGSITNWKRGIMPRETALQKIADYFNVTVQELTQSKIELSSQRRDNQNLVLLCQDKVRLIPLYESASAGFGLVATNEIIDYVPLFISEESEARETLCIKVYGDSMYPKIENGDIIQVHKQTSVDSGSLAVILLDGEEGLVKRVVYGDTWIELQSINPMFPPMRFKDEEVLRVRVVGLVKKIIKTV